MTRHLLVPKLKPPNPVMVLKRPVARRRNPEGRVAERCATEAIVTSTGINFLSDKRQQIVPQVNNKGTEQ